MKSIIKSLHSLLALAVMWAALPIPANAARVGRIITVAAGTPVQLATSRIIVRRIIIQMQVATSGGVGYVMDGVQVGTTPVANTNPTIQLCAGSASSPGCSYSDQPSTVNYDIDLQRIWVDGAHTGDTITISYETAQ